MIELTENFELQVEADALATAAAKYIAALFLPYFKTRAEHSKTKSNHSIIKYNEYYRLATQYKKEGRLLFKIESYKVDTAWGLSDFRILSKQREFPDIVVRITNGFNSSNTGYVKVEENPTELYIIIDTYSFIHSFKKSTDELIDTVKHELRHLVQMISKTGLPKEKVLNRTTDLLGYNSSSSGRTAHHMRDIEFKTNLHTYAFHIKRYLNKNFPKNKWETAFKELISNNYSNNAFYRDERLNEILENIDDMKKKEPVRWRQFIKELYKLIFL